MSEITTITEPKVYLVGRQSIDQDSLSRFLAAEGVEKWSTDTDEAGQALVEVAGRLCYKSYARPRPGGNAAYIGHILEVGHGSVLEHAVFNFIIAGVSRSFSHELVRHRVGFGYSQLSQRFCDESGFEAVVPPALVDEVAAAKRTMGDFGLSAAGLLREGGCLESVIAGLVWLDSMHRSSLSYKHLSDYLDEKNKSIEDKTLRRKRAREAARSVLPNATETQIFVTANARALRHFVELRGSEHADAEIRRVAIEVLKILAEDSPNIFGDYVVTPDESGESSISTPHRKV